MASIIETAPMAILYAINPKTVTVQLEILYHARNLGEGNII